MVISYTERSESCKPRSPLAPLSVDEIDLVLTIPLSIRMQFGRCSVRTFYPPALEVLRNHLDIFSSFVEHKVPLDKAVEVSGIAPTGKIHVQDPADQSTVLQAVREEPHLKDSVCHGRLGVRSSRSSTVE